MINTHVFSEPSGRRYGLVQFCLAFSMLSLYVFSYVVVENSAASRWTLFIVVGSALCGIAESLPKERRRIAGVLRIAAILVLLVAMTMV